MPPPAMFQAVPPMKTVVVLQAVRPTMSQTVRRRNGLRTFGPVSKRPVISPGLTWTVPGKDSAWGSQWQTNGVADLEDENSEVNNGDYIEAPIASMVATEPRLKCGYCRIWGSC